MKKISILICITILFSFLVYATIKYYSNNIYFGIAFGFNGDKIKIFVNDKLFHEEILHFKNEIKSFEISEESKYIMKSYRYSQEDSLKIKVILDDKVDTIFFLNVKEVKGININTIHGKVGIINDFRKGGLDYMFKEG